MFTAFGFCAQAMFASFSKACSTWPTFASFTRSATALLTERQKMEAGQVYDGSDPELCELRRIARVHLQRYNNSSPNDSATRVKILSELLNAKTDAFIEPPFYCDYGRYIKLGKRVYMNFNCCVLDVVPVSIGDDTLFGPFVQVYTAAHPIDGNERTIGNNLSLPISIGKNCWIGGGSVICPGITIGDNCVVAAGSVVTKHVPSNSVVAGNPARIVRTVPPLKDSQ
jgi:maltose O-acetyltransferase